MNLKTETTKKPLIKFNQKLITTKKPLTKFNLKLITKNEFFNISHKPVCHGLAGGGQIEPDVDPGGGTGKEAEIKFLAGLQFCERGCTTKSSNR